MKKIISILLVATAAVSCRGDLLDTVPTSSISSNTVWQKATLATSAVNGIYNEFYNLYSEGNGDSWRIFFEGYSSVMDIDKNWNEHYLSIYGSGTPASSDVANMFKFFYTFIFRANDAIAHLDGVPDMDDAGKSRLKSEARFLRAYAYYYLNVLWGGVPLYLDYVEDPSTAKLPRSSEREVWEAVIDDLTACIADENLPDMYAAGSSDYGRATKGAAYAYRGIAWQWLGEWQKALDDFEAVERCGYRLFTGDWAALLKPENEQCAEMIFAVQCVEQSGMGNVRGINYGNRNTGGSAWNNYLPNPAYVQSFENADGTPFDWETYLPGWNDMTPAERAVFFLRDGMTDEERTRMAAAGADLSKDLPNGNETRIRRAYDNRDPRLKKAVITPYSTYLGTTGGVEHTHTLVWPYRSDTREPWDLRTDTNSMFYYLWRKYVPVGNECTTRWVYEQDIILMRYAEVLLRRAECLNELGRTDEAVAVVNQVRTRAGHIALDSAGYPGTAVGGQDDLRERIRNEFYWELGGEDSMYFNELRWGTWLDRKFRDGTYPGAPMNSNGLMQVWGTTTYRWQCNGSYVRYWPIPAKEREMNPALTQNEGWRD